MRSYSSNQVKTSDKSQESIRPAGQSDVDTRIQDHHEACINIGTPVEQDRDEFTSLPSWSVSYRGVPYDDARLIEGIWWYSPIVGDSILRFPMQHHVTPLFENPPVRFYRRAC